MRLYLTLLGEHGVRIAAFLAGQDDGVTAHDLARLTGVPAGQVPAIVAALGRAGILRNRSGSGGGCRLGLPPGQVTIRDVVEVLEGPLSRDVCLLDRNRCHDDPPCPLHDAWLAARRAVFEALDSVTLADLAHSELARPQEVTG